MGENDPHRLLDEIQDCLERIKSLCAWQELKTFEQRQQCSNGLFMHDSTASELNNEYSRIVALGSQMHDALAARKVPTITIVRIRREHLRVKQELNSLNIPARISRISY